MDKIKIRKDIALKKRTFNDSELKELSDLLWKKIEMYPPFQNASTILLYYSLPDEVQTHQFIDKWSQSKNIILPVVSDSDLELRRYAGKDSLKEGSYHILEPIGNPICDASVIDLAFIPGVSFDVFGNRLGRGKGFYDRLLTRIKIKKIGICFHFQISDLLPSEPFDIPMDEVWCEKGRVF